jgi:CheY-like chemotaxis protein
VGIIPVGYVIFNLSVVFVFNRATLKREFEALAAADRKCILVVDDDETFLRMIRRILMTKEYSVLTAKTGEKGLQIARTQNPDLIILDVILPGLKGRAICAMLKEDPDTKDIPVMFLTAKDSPDDIRAEMAAGGISHISKPIAAKQLLLEVMQILGHT